GRAAHHQQRDKKGVLPSHQITDSAEEQSAERPHHKPDRKRRQVSDQRECFVTVRIKERRDSYGETAEDVEVVPFDHGTDCRCCDYLPNAIVVNLLGRRWHLLRLLGRGRQDRQVSSQGTEFRCTGNAQRQTALVVADPHTQLVLVGVRIVRRDRYSDRWYYSFS